jgi:hypothetical protein
MKKHKKAKVSKITIARLYNTGNYEHVRYELTADVPPGEKAEKVAEGLISVIKALNPKCPVSAYAMHERQARINWPTEQQQRIWGESWQTALEEEKAELAKDQAELDKWNANRRRALKVMDDLTDADEDDGLPF